MKRLAQIYNGKVHWIFEAETIPDFAPDIIIKDITNVIPQMQEGWDYDIETDVATTPIPVIAPPPITLDEIKDNQLVLMDAIATLFETMIGGI